MYGFTNEIIQNIAKQQSAVDLGCRAEDFDKTENVVVASLKNEGARRYLTLPFSMNLVSYGSNIVASVSEECREIVTSYIGRFPMEHCFETPNLHALNDALQGQGQRVCFMAEYFLPDLSVLSAGTCPYEMRMLNREDFPPLYLPQWSNALCKDRKELDILGVGAYDGGTLVGFAGCSMDCDSMWQIGIDVLPAYRRQGIASALTSRLAVAVLERGKVPFYCAAWSNLPSVRNALRSGFRPAWVEMTAKPRGFVDAFNAEKKQNEASF